MMAAINTRKSEGLEKYLDIFQAPLQGCRIVYPDHS